MAKERLDHKRYQKLYKYKYPDISRIQKTNTLHRLWQDKTADTKDPNGHESHIIKQISHADNPFLLGPF
jgi:hypothetical protein